MAGSSSTSETLVEVSVAASGVREVPSQATGETPASGGSCSGGARPGDPPSPRQLRDRGPSAPVVQKPVAAAGGGKGKSAAGTVKPPASSPRERIKYP